MQKGGVFFVSGIQKKCRVAKIRAALVSPFVFYSTVFLSDL